MVSLDVFDVASWVRYSRLDEITNRKPYEKDDSFLAAIFQILLSLG